MRRHWMIGLALAFVVPLVVALLMHYAGIKKEQARAESARTRCFTNMRHLALGVAMYMIDHNEEYPASLADVWQYMPNKEMFVCPADEDPMTIGDGLRCSYLNIGLRDLPLMRGQILIALEMRGQVLIAREKRGNHEGGVNAVFADYHVEWITEEELPARLEDSLRLLKAEGWDKYTPEQQEAIEAFYTGKPQP